ncbi:MAG: hypothetical protein K0R15_1147 [Clostridiales bacterium]|jgi:flagellar biosynthesis protein FlhG|nr:hypothetical protein [Clostridiales bacterium]
MMDQAEELRSILKRQNPIKSNARVITVTSGKGGVGKSNISVNLAITLKRLGKRVIVFDADFGLANVEVLFGVVPQYNLADLMYKDKGIKDILSKGPLEIEFISGGSGIQELTNLSIDQVHYLIQQLGEIDELADVIIIDTGAGISNSVLEFVIASSEILLVTTPEPTSITDSYALLKALNRNKGFSKELAQIKVITNRVSSENEGREIFNKLSTVSKKFLDLDLEFMGAVTYDLNLQKAVMEQRPVTMLYENSNASQDINNIAKRILDIEIQTPKKGIAQMFSRLIKLKLTK